MHFTSALIVLLASTAAALPTLHIGTIRNSTLAEHFYPRNVNVTDVLPQSLNVTDVLPRSLNVTDVLPRSLNITDVLPRSLNVTDVLPRSLNITEAPVGVLRRSLNNGSSAFPRFEIKNATDGVFEHVEAIKNTTGSSRPRRSRGYSSRAVSTPAPAPTPTPTPTPAGQRNSGTKNGDRACGANGMDVWNRCLLDRFF